ncbi:sel1 repeat family protein [Nocardia sp. CS682]|uniref:sel1 repeat family protein n=1 Tax=Nocardia sp. CS682 TaxID=1047172 RepID=UPI0010751C15|nr:sel1 repeat family protein [Nocardia sp. CS682]
MISREARVVAAALMAGAVAKGRGFAPPAVVEEYAALQTSIISREPHLTLSELARWEASPNAAHDSAGLADMFEDTASLDEHRDLVRRAEGLFATTQQLLAQRAEAEGDAGLMCLLGGLFDDVRKLDRAEDWYTAAAELGNTAAMLELARLLNEMHRTDEAPEWEERAAVLGDTSALITLSRRLRDDPDRWAEVVAPTRQSAAAGNALAMVSLAYVAEDRGAIDEAEMWYQNASYVDADLTRFLHQFYFGNGMFMSDEYTQKAAEAGDPRAMSFHASSLHSAGEAGAAEQWYRRAIAAGDKLATIGLANLLVSEDRATEAEDWCRKAADSGYMLAALHMGSLLRERGADSEAGYWYRLAADAGYLAAKDSLAELDRHH